MIEIDGSFWTISVRRRALLGQSVLLCPDGESFSSGRIVMTPEGNLSQWMHQLKTAYTVYFNRRHQVVRASVSGQIQEYGHRDRKIFAGGEPLSAFQSGARSGAGPGNTNEIRPADSIEPRPGRCWKDWEYRRWVEEGLIGEIEDPFEAVKWQQVLGGEGFLRKLQDQWNQRVERPKNYGQKKNWSAVGAEQILERVSEHFNPILRGSRNAASATIWHGGARLRCAGITPD